MPESTEQLVAEIGADLSGLESGLNQAQSQTQRFAQRMQRVGAELSVAVTAPLLLIGKQVLEIGFSYEKAMNTFQAVTRATGEEMAAAGAQAEKLGADMTLPATSAADAALAMTELAKGGFTAAQAMDAARGSLQLAAAAQVSEAQAAEITANALNTFHLAATESVRVSDLLAAASNASSAEITDIASSMQQAGASAAALGIPIEDLVTSIGLMANAGIKGSDAGTSLKTMMAALTPSTEKAANAMKALGIDAFDAQGNFVGLEAIVAQAAPALARLTVEERARAIQAAFGNDAQRAANIILGEGVDAWNKMGEAVGQSGAAAELAAAKTKGLSGAWDGFVSQMETVGLKVFQQVAPMLEKVVRGLAEMTAGLATLNPKVMEFGITAAAVAGSAGPLALLAGKLLALGPQGAAVAAVIAGAALMAGAYKTDFGAMQRTLDDFVAHFSSSMSKGQSSAGSFSVFMSKFGISLVAVFDTVLVAVEKATTQLKMLFDVQKAFYTGHVNEVGKIWAKGNADLEAISVGFRQRNQQRQNEFNALERGGVEEHWRLLRDRGAKGSSDYAQGIIEGYKQKDPLGQIKTITIGEMTSFEGKLRASGLAAGLTFGESLKQGAFTATHQSPFFMIHWLQEAADFAKNEAPAEFGKAGSKMGEKLREGFQFALGNINDLLNRAIGGTGNVSESVFDIMLRKFPEVVKELGTQATGFRETNKAIELYAAVMTTASGRNTEFAQKVKTAIGSLLQFDRVSRELSGITPIFADLGGAIEETTIVTKEMGEAIRTAVGSLVTATLQEPGRILREQIIAWASAGKAAKEWGKVMSEGVVKLKNEIKSNLGDGVGGILIAFADKFKISLTKINDWSSGVLDIVGVLPGKIGEKLRKVTDTFSSWINRIDTLLRGLHKIFNSIPDGIGPMIQSIVGLFNKTSAVVASSATAVGSSLEHVTTAASGMSTQVSGSVSKMGAAAHDAFGGISNSANETAKTVNNAARAVMTSLAAVATFAATRGQGKFVGVMGGAAAGAQIGSLFGPVGTLVGAGVGAVVGLFKSGKSDAQKRAEEEAKQRAGMDMQKFAADIMSAQMDGLKKGLEFLQSLEGFSQVSQKAVKRFFNAIELVLQLFADMAGRFKAESLEQSKALTESMGSSFGFLLSGADLIKAISELAAITDQNISDFIATTMKIINAWVAAAAQIELQTAKFTGKIADKLMSSFEFLRIVPEVIKGFAESVKIDDGIIESVFATVNTFITKMKELSESQRGLELNRAGASAGLFSEIFEASKGMLEFFKQLSEYKPLDESLLAIVTSDLQKILDWGNTLAAMTETGIANFQSLGASIGRLATSMHSATNGISALAGGLSGEGITANIQSGNGAGLLARGANAAAPSITNNYNTNVYATAQGSIQTEGEFEQFIERQIEKALKKQRDELRLSSVS